MKKDGRPKLSRRIKFFMIGVLVTILVGFALLFVYAFKENYKNKHMIEAEHSAVVNHNYTYPDTTQAEGATKLKREE